MLTHSLAQEVAEETAAVTGLGILITDPAGIVIGSSDPKRVGTFHEASIDVVRTREPATHTAKQASALRGVRPGLTAPIVVDGQAVGTVGITGSPARVRRFGPVVRRHTEMLLEESAALQTRLLRERATEDLLHDIASYNPELVEPELVVSRAAELGYDLHLRRAVVVLEVSLGDGEPHAPAHDVSLLRSELVRTIREQFAEGQTVVASLGSGAFAVLHRLPAGISAADADAATAAICERAVAAISTRHHLATRAGIAGPATTPAQLHDAYLDASDALRLGATLHPQDTVLTIAGLRKHQLLGAAGPRTRQRLIDAELPLLRSSPDWPALRQTIVAWCESGFNLVRAATHLHVHRNTLIYRLAKIEQLTGRNLRDHPASLTLYLACLADELDTSQAAAPSRRLDSAPHAPEPS
jgi:carbohydrate diacid regulator